MTILQTVQMLCDIATLAIIGVIFYQLIQLARGK
jgi:hypothetical protein